MPAKLVTYNSQNYAGTLGSGLVQLSVKEIIMIRIKFMLDVTVYVYHNWYASMLVANCA